MPDFEVFENTEPVLSGCKPWLASAAENGFLLMISNRY